MTIRQVGNSGVAVGDGEYPATIDWRLSIERYRGRQIILISARQATSVLGTLPVAPDRLGELARHLGLSPLTKSNNGSTPKGSQFEVVLATRTLSVESAGKRFLGCNPANLVSADLGKLGIQESVSVVIALGEPRSFRSASEFIRDAVSRRSAFVVEAALFDFRSSDPRMDRYHFLRSDSSAETGPDWNTSAVLDANVVLDMERCINSKTLSLDSADNHRRFETIRDLTASFRGLDLIPGPAIAELSKAHTGHELTRESLARFRAALDVWTDTRNSDLELDVLHRLVTERERQHLADDEFDDFEVRNDFQLSDFGYLTLLKLAELYRPLWGKKFSCRERINAYGKFVDFINQDGLGRNAYPAIVARSVLIAGQDVEQAAWSSLLHRGKSMLENLRNAAHDLVYPTLVDMMNVGLVGETEGRVVYLVTADKPLARLRRSARLVDKPMWLGDDGLLGSIEHPDQLHPEFSAKQVATIREQEATLNSGAFLRSFTKQTMNPIRVSQEIFNLEPTVSRLWADRS